MIRGLVHAAPVAAAAVAAGVAAALAAPGAARWLVRTRPLPRCDLMVVPAGGALERLSAAVDLMSGGACSRILLTGPSSEGTPDGARELLEEIGDGRRLEPHAFSRHTFEDAIVALEAARRSGARSVLVVTSPYHTRRASWVFSRVFAGSGVALGVHPSGTFYMDYDRWWAGRHGRRAVLGEYAKLWLYGVAAEAIRWSAAGAVS